MERLTYKEKETVHWSTFGHSHIKYAFSCGRSAWFFDWAAEGGWRERVRALPWAG